MNGVFRVCLVSDGIVVDFVNGTKCYFPASFLLESTTREGNQLLLGYDPSETSGIQADMPPVEEFAVSSCPKLIPGRQNGACLRSVR